jgi:hypothetical protein
VQDHKYCIHKINDLNSTQLSQNRVQRQDFLKTAITLHVLAKTGKFLTN